MDPLKAAAPEIMVELYSVNLMGLEGVIADLLPHKWPAGAELLFMEPGKLEHRGVLGMRAGAMVLILSPEAAEKIRSHINANKAALTEQAKAALNPHGTH